MTASTRTARASQELSLALRGLRDTAAPASLTGRVFARVGLRDSYVRVSSRIGDVYVARGKRGVAAVRPAKSDAAYEAWHERSFGYRPAREAHPSSAYLKGLRQVLAGRGASRTHVDLRGLSAFERAVLGKTREIPRGEVRPYAWVAREIGHPLAVRAVGNTLAKNPVPLIIPCHRVVRSDGAVGRYVFGAAAKRALLSSEGAM